MTRVLPAEQQRRPERRARAEAPRSPGERSARTARSSTRRRWLVAVLAVALPLAVFVPLAIQARNGHIASWDAMLSDRIHAYENRETILNSRFDLMGAVLRPAVQVLGFLMALAAALAIFARGYRRPALLIVLAVVGAVILGVTLKEIFEPPVGPADARGSGFEFPSGHALRSMAAGAALALASWPTRWRWPVVAASTAIVLVVGFAVVYHEWHLVSEVLGAWCIGVAWVACLALVLRPGPRGRF